tara:strand:+ start:206 stop:937 length:732 start_codon:yes stop_codon:yes gene_type:complete
MLESNKKQLLNAKHAFIPTANHIHNSIYDYSKTVYIDAKTKVEIICNIHGSFYQLPRFHIRKKQPTGCPKCNGGIKYTQQEFIKKSNITHNNKYDYSLSEYKNFKTKVKIICPTHGIFNQQPNNHIFGQGCPKCKSSKGELKIEQYLNKNNIQYSSQHTFNDCRGIKRPLPFDFYLHDYNICIEFQGEQHFRPAFGIESFQKIRTTDKIKEIYCNKKSITLCKINYDEITEIETILNFILYPS